MKYDDGDDDDDNGSGIRNGICNCMFCRRGLQRVGIWYGL